MNPNVLCALLAICAASLAAADAAVAVINGEAITTSQLAKGVPAGAFGQTRTFAREYRLRQLIVLTQMRQQLTALGANADPAEVEKAFAAKLAAPPPSAGCGCCASYRDFDDYLVQTYMTREDARLGLWIDMATDNYAKKTWEMEHPGTDGAAAAVAAEGPRIRTAFRKIWMMGFDLDDDEDVLHPKPGRPSWQHAKAAIARLKAGEDFETVAQTVQKSVRIVDQARHGETAPLQVLRDYGITDEQVAQTPAGMVSEPLAYDARWLVVSWKPLSDHDVLIELQARHADGIRERVVKAALGQGKVQYVGEGLALAPAEARERPGVPAAGGR